MRPLTELNRIINHFVIFLKLPYMADFYFKKFSHLTDITTQEDKNNVLQFLYQTGSSWDTTEAKQIKKELMQHLEKSAGQLKYEPNINK